jgi:DNA-binding transcriptional LysR family regulator
MREFPEVEIQVDLTDRLVNLQEDGYDLAIRVGVLTESLLIRKKLAPDRQVIVASPEYLELRGVPGSPDELTEHCCLSLCDSWQWTFNKDGKERSVRVNGRLRSNSGEILRHAAIEGQGLFCTSELRVLHDLEQGRLVRVLKDYDVTANSAIWALYQSPKHVLPKMRALLDFLAEWFRNLRPIDNDLPMDRPKLLARPEPNSDRRARITPPANASRARLKRQLV